MIIVKKGGQARAIALHSALGSTSTPQLHLKLNDNQLWAEGVSPLTNIQHSQAEHNMFWGHRVPRMPGLKDRYSGWGICHSLLHIPLPALRYIFLSLFKTKVIRIFSAERQMLFPGLTISWDATDGLFLSIYRWERQQSSSLTSIIHTSSHPWLLPAHDGLTRVATVPGHQLFLLSLLRMYFNHRLSQNIEDK